MRWPLRRLVRVTVLIAGLAALAGGVIALRSRSEPVSPPRRRSPTAATDVALAARLQRRTLEAGSPPAEAVPPAPAGETGPLPSSLAGTDVDGWLGVDDNGHLVVTPGARWFFDYFLSATGEEPPEEIRARIVAEIDRRLPAPGAREAIGLLDRYLAYRERVRTLQASGAADDLQQRLAQLRDIRTETFGDANAAALFGEEERVQALDIQRREVLRDETLAPEERERRLAELEQQLPAAVRQARSESMTLVQLREDEEHLRDAGASPEDVHALREQRFGAAAADRLDALDRERAEWQQRLDDYHSARQAIDNAAALPPDARARAVEALLAERFTPEERRRVEALDGLRAEGE